ncbi:hypothetical protein [Niabella sp.]|uniref:hypothetical protein n=1 Tax=Niabella sp. TaxID=1962976 RepID=UPI00260D63F9|nr:hypothetical protein [Niabella sp.]
MVLLPGLQIVRAQPPEKMRLGKMVVKGNDFTSETSYEYNARLHIKKIVYKQDGKLHYTIDNFLFDTAGQLISYVKTYKVKISPQKTTVYYNCNKQVERMVLVNTQKTNKPDTINIFDFSRDGNRVTVKSSGSTTVYQYDESGNIKQVEFSGNGAAPFLFDRYDHSSNPLAFTGGYMDEKPLSKNNHSWQQLGEARYIATRKITYAREIVHTYKPGGPKIPTQYRNGLPLQVVTSWYDPDAKRSINTETITYTYIY